MYRDPYGYLWIGGEALERYDGYEFYNYNTDTQDTLSPEGNVMCVAMDSVGDLWMGAYGGINRYFYQRGYFKRYNYAYDENNQQYPLPPAVLDVIIDKAGEVWIASGGIYKYNPGKDYFDVVPYNLQGLDEEYIFNDEAVSAYSPIRDEIYIGVNYYGLLIYSIKDKNTRFLPSGQITGHPSSEYQDILVDKQGKVWVATVSHGAIVYDPFTDSFTQYTIEPGKTDDHTSVNYPDIRSLGLMYNGKVALGTDSKGLNIFDPETGLFEYYLHDYKNPNSIATNGVTNIITGPQNILWLFCFDGGISYYDPNWKRFEHYRKTGKYENELTDNTITGFAEDNTGNIWITTKEGGVNYWNRIQEKFMHTEFLNARTNKPVKNFQAVTRDADGDIWFGSADAGIFRYSPRLNDTIHYYHSENTNSPSGDDVTGIVTDHKGRVW
ncbi:MAG: ligand-binding sensor domain-containing protein, partial [Bacteroidota bacterium]